MIAPPDVAISAALAAAAKSPCAKSKRGVAAYVGDYVCAAEFNGPPAPFGCDASTGCWNDCGKRCVHAEMRAMRPLANMPSRLAATIRLVHVELAPNGGVVACDGPKCWQCSREILDVGIGGIWLYEADEILADIERVGRWIYYDATAFHRTTLEACEIGGPR